MNTKTMHLDKEKVSKLEYHDTVGKNSASLSPFAMPRKIDFFCKPEGGLYQIKVEYFGKEDLADEEMLDDLDNPVITVVTSKYTRKVTDIKFSSPISKHELKRVSARLRVKANNSQRTLHVGNKLSLLLCSSILDDLSGEIFKHEKNYDQNSGSIPNSYIS